jgi:tetratricopeptide (TPR) repeat protein
LNTFTRISLFILTAAAILSCSRKKNSFVSRNYHAITSEYNTLYNGGLAFEQGKEEINHNYADNYWDILPVERLALDENIVLPDSVRNQNFGIAEEKAVKAIQKHSMQIGGKERNPQMDEAYLLLGKSRYFDQRFVPALDAFNYILYRYPASDNITHAKIWREKTNIRLGNEKLAIKNLKKILDSDKLNDEDIADASSSLAQAYINLQYIDSAVVPLQNASEFTSNNAEKGRYYYILGQLYDRMDQSAAANASFDKVIDLKRKSPRIYLVNAHIQKARNFDFQNGDRTQLLALLRDLEEDRENRPFLDKIYFQIGEYYNRLDSVETAVNYYNRSLRSPSSDIFLKSINYEILANINFDEANYQQAGKYFDSTLTYMSPDLLEFRTISKKRENLADVILYEEIAEETDSILRLANMTEDDRLQYFTAYTDTLRARAVKTMESGELPAYTAGIGPRTNFPQTNIPASASVPPAGDFNSGNGGNIFYFYNPIRVSRGAQDFLRTWGSRELADNWRYGSRAMNQSTVNAEERLMDINLDNDPIYDPQTYLAQIPTEALVLDSLSAQRNRANYQLGVIYNEKYREYALAANRLEFMLNSNPQQSLILPAKYNLYSVYKAQNRVDDLRRLEQDILQNYPDSRYAAFIRNPQSVQIDENSPENVYEQLFRKFEAQNFVEVIEQSDAYRSQYNGNSILPKIELLKTQAIARLYGIDSYENSLQYVAANYPQSPEGQKAQQLLNTAIPSLKNLEFVADSTQTNFKLVLSFSESENVAADSLEIQIEEKLEELDYRKIKTSRDVYDAEQTFVVIHGLSSRSAAQGFLELLQKDKNIKIEGEAFVMSAENYRIVQIKKNLRDLSNLN